MSGAKMTNPPRFDFETISALPASQLLVDTFARRADQLADVALRHLESLRGLKEGMTIKMQQRLGEAGSNRNTIRTCWLVRRSRPHRTSSSRKASSG